MNKNIALYLIIGGVALNGIDLLTSKAGQGGMVFGTTGFLRGVNNALPVVNVPYFNVPINLGGWLVIAGAVTYAIQEWM